MHLENFQEFHFKKTEFGEFSKFRCEISKLMFFSKSSNSRVESSLENFPNSSAEFGEFSKLRFCERTAGSHSFLLGPQGLDAFTCGCTCHDVKMKLSRLKCVSSLCSGHATVLNRWSRNRKLSHSSSTWRVSNRQSCTQFSLTAIAL